MGSKAILPEQISADAGSMRTVATHEPPVPVHELTFYVFVTAFVAAQAGLIFGYDLVGTRNISIFPVIVLFR